MGLRWGVTKALVDSADLERRVEEFHLFARHADPFADPDMTYPPSAPPVFAGLIAPFSRSGIRPFWIALNLVSLGIFAASLIRIWGRDWPSSVQAAVCLVAAASKPTRAGIALGQFHLIPMALIGVALVQRGRWLLPGLCLGVALVKPTMVGPLLIVLALQGRWKMLGVAAAVQGGLWLGTAWWVHVGPTVLLHEWLENARSQLASGTIDIPTMLGGDGSKISLAMIAVSGLILIGLRRRSEAGQAAVALFLAAIVTYHRHYDMVLLLPALAGLVQGGFRGRRGEMVVALGFAILLMSPAPPTSWGERAARIYDVGFIVGSYVALIALIINIATEERRDHTKELGPCP